MDILVLCGFGMETATKLELKRLGYNALCIDGRFELKGDEADVVRLNLHLRTADRVLIKLNSFRALTFDDLFEGVSQVDWCEILPQDGFIAVNAKSFKSVLFALSSIQSITKKAIVTKMLKKYPSLPESGERFGIEIGIVRDEVTVSLDTSGAGLHKRGYRKLVWEAPLKETLAAGIIELSGWKGDRAVIDPFTGSGTFPIECCMKALSIPAGFYRNFAFESYPFINPDRLMQEKKEASDKIEWDKKVRIAGYDIKPKAVSIAVKSAKEFGLDKYIHFQTQDMRKVSSRYEGGAIFANPPYGERLMSGDEVELLYKDFGIMHRSLDNWSASVITSYPKFERCFGRRADRERKVYNAKLLCRIYNYFSQKKDKNE